ncbi:MAG: hypothetical protein LAO04_10580 [Acidobacteriia bacterium]|nr:hypothetical protein [Terriglobia bacterium]
MVITKCCCARITAIIARGEHQREYKRSARRPGAPGALDSYFGKFEGTDLAGGIMALAMRPHVARGILP